MANETNSQQPTAENQIVGMVKIVNGMVQAQAPGDAIRDLIQDSQIYANDRIMTGEEGSISIVFLDPGQTQLNIGRMSDMTISEDVFQVGFPTDLEEATADVEQIQEALLAGEFDPTTDLEATAAGPAAGGGERGGGRTIIRFDAEGREVTPESGAETTGVQLNFVETDPSPTEELEIAPALFAAPIVGGGGGGGTEPIPPTLDIDRVVEEEAMDYRTQYFSRIHQIEGEDASTVDYWHFSTNSSGWVSFDLLSEQSPWSNPDNWTDLDGDHENGNPDQDNLDTHIRLFNDNGDGELGDQIPWYFGGENNDSPTWLGGDGSSSSEDSFIGLWLPDGGSYILVVGDSWLSTDAATSGVNQDSGEIENGPYQIRIAGDISITEVPSDGYITSKPSLSDGNPDQNDIINDDIQPDSAVVSGNLGAGSWTIASITGQPALSSQGELVTYELNTSTPGQFVLEAWVRYGGEETLGDDIESITFRGNDFQEDRLVFTLQVEPDGDYEFTLLDQLDNVTPGFVGDDGEILDEQTPDAPLSDENIQMIVLGPDGEPTGWVDTLDFSANLQVTFPAGHPSAGTWSFPAGSFTIQTVDDSPVAIEGLMHPIKISVEEDGMNPYDDSYRELMNDNQDLSEGIKSYHDDNNDDEDSGEGYNSIARLFSLGADEFPSDGEDQREGPPMGKYGLSDDNLDDIPQLWSQGQQVTYNILDNILTATAGEGDDMRVVFTLTVDPDDGSWYFDLDDQLDHVDQSWADSAENYSLRTGAEWDGDESIIGLDLSSLLTATDFDGDMVVGAAEGSFLLKVQDDVPKLVCKSEVKGTVEESALSTSYLLSGLEWPADSSNGNPGKPPWEDYNDDTASESLHSNGSLMQLIQEGSDEDVTFKLSSDTSKLQTLFSKGEALYYQTNPENGTLTATAGEFGPVVFTLKIEENGDWSFDLDDQLDHVDDPNDEQNSMLRTSLNDANGAPFIDLSSVIRVEDFDGDTITLHNKMFVIEVEDDIPVLNCKNIDGFVEEDGMSIMYGDQNDINDIDDSSEGNPGPRHRYDRRESYSDDEDEGHGTGWRGQSLATLVSDGADEDITFKFSDDVITYMEDQNLSSQENALTYKISDDKLDLIAKSGVDGPVVFTLHLAENGDWSFDLDDQLNHVAGDGENFDLLSGDGSVGYINFSGAVVATDFDGDETALKATQFKVYVQDDLPITDSYAYPINGGVEEAALSRGYHQSDHEKPVDSSEGTDTKWHNSDDTDSSHSSGSLTTVVKDGADEDVSFSLWGVGEGFLPDLYSKGELLNYKVTNNITAPNGTVYDTLVATANGNTIFTMKVAEDGRWQFDLDDQLDHEDDGTNSRNIALVSRDQEGNEIFIDFVDFSGMIKVEDFDHDIITLDNDMFTMTITDDKPVLTCHNIQGFVEEDGMSFADEPGDGPTDHDNSEGNHNWWEWRETPNDDEDRGSGTGYLGESLHTLVQDGADENVTFEFADFETIVKPYMEDQGLTSQGRDLKYEVQGNALRAYTTVDQGTITVFTLHINDTNGNWYFDLDDQLDHNYWEHNGVTGGYGENTYLQSQPPEDSDDPVTSISRIEFSGAILAVDADGDEVQLGNGQFTMKVQDDVPVLCSPQTRSVREAELDDGSSPNSAATVLSGNFISDGNIKVGADEPPTIAIFFDDEWHYITIDGSDTADLVVGGNVEGDDLTTAGKLTIDSDGNWAYQLVDNTLTHPDNLVDSPNEHPVDGDREWADHVTDEFGIWVRDFDHDWAKMYLKVNILDDGPSISISEVDPLGTEFVMEDALGKTTDNSDNDTDSDLSLGNLDDPSEANSQETDSATFHLGSVITDTNTITNFGADGAGTSYYSITGLNSPQLSAHESAGQQIWYFHNPSTNIIEARTTSVNNTPDSGGTLIFTFTVNADTGISKFNLNDQMDHGPAAGDQGTLNITDIGQYVQYTITDGDGDKASVNFDGFITVNVENDVPEVVETAQYFFVSEYAGYNNAIGIYVINEGVPEFVELVLPESDIADWAQAGTGDINLPNPPTNTNPYSYDAGGNLADAPFHYTPGLNLEDYPEGSKLFIIADADNKFDPDGPFAFVENTGTDPDAPPFVLQYNDGNVINVDGVMGVYFMDSSLNQSNEGDADRISDHFTDQWASSPAPEHFLNDSPEFGGEVRIEDKNLGDIDYDDTVLRIEKGPVVSEAALTQANLDADVGSQTGGNDLGTQSDPWHTSSRVSGNFFVATLAGIQFLTGADEALTLNIDPMGIPEFEGGDGLIFNEDQNLGNGSNIDPPVTITNGALFDQNSAIHFYGESGTLTVWNNGSWEYQLTDNTLKHTDNDKGSEDNHDGDYDRYAADQVQEVFNITATDFDGDSVVADFIVNINDDGPQIGNPQDAILVNGSSKEFETTSPSALFLDHEFSNQLVAELFVDFGADGEADYDELGVHPLQLAGPTHNGELDGYVVDNNGTLLTYGNEKLLYESDNEGGLIAVTEQGRLEIFTVEVNPDNGTYEVTLIRDLDGATGSTINFTHKDLNSGGPSPVEWVEIDKDGDGFIDIKVKITGQDGGDHNQNPNTINISKAGIGVVDQWVEEDPAETLKFEFFDRNGSELDVSKVSFTIDSLNEEHGQASDELLSWTTNSSTGPNPTVSGDGNGASDDQVFNIVDSNGFNTVYLTAGPSPSSSDQTDDYRVENMTIYTTEEAFDSTITYDLTATDGDGDIASTTFDVTFDGEGVIDGTDAAEVIAGGMGNDIILAGGGDDIIFGGKGIDTIDGDDGDDVITGEQVVYNATTGEPEIIDDGETDIIDGGFHTVGDTADVAATGIETTLSTEELENLLPPIEVV